MTAVLCVRTKLHRIELAIRRFNEPYPTEPSWSEGEIRLLPPPPSINRVSRAIDTLATFVVAFMGGILLLAPMFALTYVRKQKYQLITVVLFVLFFAFAVAASTKATNQEMLGATAAYAAVLVILINQNPV